MTVTLVDVLWCSQQHGTNIDERETLSNNTEYQERLREDRIKGASQGREREDQLKLDQESRQLQQQVSVVRSRYSQYCQLCSE